MRAQIGWLGVGAALGFGVAWLTGVTLRGSQEPSAAAVDGAVEQRLRSMESQMARLSELIAGTTGPVLEPAPRSAAPRSAPETPTPTTEPTGWERVAAAMAALKPEDYRTPLPNEDQRQAAAWGSLGAVQRKLRDQDGVAWAAWAGARAAQDVTKHTPSSFAERDRDWVRELFRAYFEEQTPLLLSARTVWEDRSKPYEERDSAYKDWLRAMNAAAEARNKKLVQYLEQHYPDWWHATGEYKLLLPP